jgi:hypothetical protein
VLSNDQGVEQGAYLITLDDPTLQEIWTAGDDYSRFPYVCNAGFLFILPNLIFVLSYDGSQYWVVDTSPTTNSVALATLGSSSSWNCAAVSAWMDTNNQLWLMNAATNPLNVLVGIPPPVPSAQVADLWFGQTPGFIDLRAQANRLKFVNVAGGAQYLGTDGSIPFGTAPPVFLTAEQGQPAATFANNGGSGGVFTVSGGALSLASSNPPGSTYEQTIQQPANTPQGADPQIMLDWSDDGARTWSQLKLWRSMGKIGEYLKRLRWLKMGQARQRVLRLRITDPVRRNFLGFYLDIEPGQD